MEPSQTNPDNTSFPESCTTQINNPLLNADDLLQEIHSSLEDDMLFDTIPMNPFMLDEYWYAPPCVTRHTHIAIDDDDDDAVDTQMQCPPLFESLTEGTITESSSNTLSSAAGSTLPAFLSRETSSNILSAVNNSSFNQFSPGYSDVSSFPAHQLSPSPMLTSDDSYFHSNESCLTTTKSPPPFQLNLAMARASPPPLNLEATASQSLLHPGTGACLFYHHLEAANRYDTAACRADGDRADHNDENVVAFLVEDATLSVGDGYIWRKYGQKKIKDKLHPRAYFKCAQPDCLVKKHIENSDVQGSILITYINKHNHNRPV